jgi:hypothetical protein
MRRLFTVLSAAAIFAACGGKTSSTSGGTSSGGTSGGTSSGGASGGAAPTTSEQSYCDQRETRAKACSAGATTFSRVSCSREYACTAALLAAPDSYFSCRVSLECTAPSDNCLTQAVGGRTVPQTDLCMKKHAECKTGGGKGFDDDVCEVLAALNDAPLQKLSGCLDLPCAQVDDCFEDTAEAISPACN